MKYLYSFLATILTAAAIIGVAALIAMAPIWSLKVFCGVALFGFVWSIIHGMFFE